MVTRATLNASKHRGFTHFKIALSSIVFKITSYVIVFFLKHYCLYL